MNPLIEGTGFDRKTEADLKFEKGPSNRTRQLNKYMKYQVKVLKGMVHRGELSKFWRLS